MLMMLVVMMIAAKVSVYRRRGASLSLENAPLSTEAREKPIDPTNAVKQWRDAGKRCLNSRSTVFQMIRPQSSKVTKKATRAAVWIMNSSLTHTRTPFSLSYNDSTHMSYFSMRLSIDQSTFSIKIPFVINQTMFLLKKCKSTLTQ